ncbi:hypothetical protein [Altericista sp. CCNU0014]|uniref:hypothetical protein n=1 Tax=Altericista sp. CCNU0014 TaxID=3082949 RepID=UPI00384E718D
MLLNSASYHKIAPHLVLMAFLYRVVNGRGTLEREYAIGRDRMDLCLQYGSVIVGIEVKVQRLGLDFGWSVICDRRKTVLPIATRLRSERHQTDLGRTIEVIYT